MEPNLWVLQILRQPMNPGLEPLTLWTPLTVAPDLLYQVPLKLLPRFFFCPVLEPFVPHVLVRGFPGPSLLVLCLLSVLTHYVLRLPFYHQCSGEVVDRSAWETHTSTRRDRVFVSTCQWGRVGRGTGRTRLVGHYDFPVHDFPQV